MTGELPLIEEFISESREHLSGIEGDFMALEKQGDAPDKELVNKIFRAIHTIKGTSGFFGLKNIGLLTHTMETVLSCMRDGNIAPCRVVTDAMLAGVDVLHTLLDDLPYSDEKDIGNACAALEKLIPPQQAKRPATRCSDTIPLLDKSGEPVGFEARATALRSVPAGHHFLYLLHYDLTAPDQMNGKNPVELIQGLRGMGEIIDGVLDLPSKDLPSLLPAGPLFYHALYSTVIDASLIAEAVGLPPASIDAIDDGFLIPTTPPEEPIKISAHDETVQNLPPAALRTRDANAEEPPAKIMETLRIRLDLLDELMMLAGELVLVRNQQLLHVDKADPVSRAISQRLDIVTSSLQECIMRTRMQPIGSIFGKFTRIVRDLGNKLGKKIELEISGNEVELDKTILEALADPLTHLIRNCCDHGIEIPERRRILGKPETGRITIAAYHEGGRMNIEIADDGKGIDCEAIKKTAVEKQVKTGEEVARMGEKELLSLIFLPGFTTAEAVSDISGRGVGMDVVRMAVEKLNGVIDIKTALQAGTRIHLRLPLTLAIIPSLIVISGGQRYVIPQINLEELVCIYDEQIYAKIECAGNHEVYRLRNILLPIVHLEEIFRRPDPWTDHDKSIITETHRVDREKRDREFAAIKSGGASAGISLTFAVLKAGNLRFGLVVDSVLGTEEIVVKPMHRLLKRLPIYSGATVLGDGRVALILDVLGICRHAGIEFADHESAPGANGVSDCGTESRDLLLFKSGDQELFAFDLAAVKRIECIKTEHLEKIGDREFITLGNQSVKIIRLESLFSISPGSRRDEMFLLMPKRAPQPCGILASKLVDIGSFTVTIDTRSVPAEGITGSAIIKNHMSLILDMEKILGRSLAG